MIRRIEPTSVGYSKAVLTTGPGQTLYISGQLGVDENGGIPPDFQGQVTQALNNVVVLLTTHGMTPANLVKLTVFLKDMKDLAAYRAARDAVLGTEHPAASSAVQIVQLAAPQFLVEIEAIAFSL